MGKVKRSPRPSWVSDEMPPRSKRTIEEIIDQEDSADSDYDERASRPARTSKGTKKSTSRPARKKRRRGYGSDDDDDIDDEGELSAGSFEDEAPEDEPLELNPRGRPVRKAVKERKNYEESDEDEDVFGDSQESEAEEVIEEPKKEKRSRLLVKLKTHTPHSTPGPSARKTIRSGSHGSKRQPTPEGHGIRRSSRIAHDEQDTMVALTNSGHHVEVVRQSTRSPEGIPARVYKGGKGLKHPSKSTIDEEDSNRTKQEDDDEPGVELEIKASQHEIMESDPQGDVDEARPILRSDTQNATQGDTQGGDVALSDGGFVPESGNEQEPEEDDDDEDPISKGRRSTRASSRRTSKEGKARERSGGRSLRRSHRTSDKRPARSSQRKGQEESSDFEPNAEEGAEDDMSDSAHSQDSPQKGTQRAEEESESSNGRRSGRLRKGKSRQRTPVSVHSDIADELAGELEDLKGDRPRRQPRPQIIYEDKPRRRNRKSVDYRLLRPELALPTEDVEDDPSATPSRRARRGGGGTWQRSLFSTFGPFGGAGGPAPVLGGPGGVGATGGVDSESSDDETMQRPRGVGGTVGMTPTSAFPPGFGMFPPGQTHNADPAQGPSGTPANLGKIKDKQALADADPLGVDQNVNFDGVGGLEGHIDQLKEMVSLPLLYPEIFQRFHITPPRGVLFHGPPGTGKTLLARALATSVSSQGRKVTFYMRKGADALSKWVGEAERQLRLLFEEARKNQPSIIFFDEIDGLAPVRSSKQEQIHASIVSTLLALMDGMDGRGQVIVIGATNRPDSIDPALRRPGRFDREFYFPLPNTEARRAILDIHTKGWDPPLPIPIKNELAEVTKGYGGADLRALCTEAALNAVQRKYPQIYKSNEKLLIDPKKIKVTPRDFMMCIKKMIPSSERSTSSGAAPLPKAIEPLLRQPLNEIKNIISEVLPQKRKMTALEEALFEEPEGESGFRRERMQAEFETSRVFRPRLLVRGVPGMGQQYLAAAMLNHFEGLHVQNFDLPTLLSDSTRSPEATVVQLFSEVKMHKPSVIYIPNVQAWYTTVGQTVISTFLGLLRSLPPTDPILLLGVLENEREDDDEDMLRNLFGFSKKNRYDLEPPRNPWRHEFFTSLINYIKTTPTDFPEPANRKTRKLETLQPAPQPAPKEPEPPTKEELKVQRKKDRQTLNLLKIRIQPIMDQIKKYKKFRTGVVDETQIRYLYEEEVPTMVSSDLPVEQLAKASFRPYEKGNDVHGVPGLVEQISNKFYYNLEIVTIEKRLSNGYYKRPHDFLADIKRLSKDAKTLGDQERLLKANELQANVEVDIGNIEFTEPALVAECENVYQRELKREKEALEKARQAAEAEGTMAPPMPSNVAHGDSGPSTVNQSSGPVVLGEPLPNGRPTIPVQPITPSRPSHHSSLTNGYSAGPPHGGSDLNDLGGHPPTSNGSSHLSHGDGDVHMTNSDEPHSADRETQNSSFGPSAQPRPPHSYTAPTSQLRHQSGLSNLSQKGTITPMAPDSHPEDYANDASTTQTTSNKKSSDPASGPHHNTQSSAGVPMEQEGPDLTTYPDRRSTDGQLPDTQGESNASQQSPTSLTDKIDVPFSQGSAQRSSQSQKGSQQSSQPPVPPFDVPSRPHQSIHALLNNEDGHQPLTIDHESIRKLHNDLTQRSSGCSVEQLEQINTSLMDCVWKMRGDWNRTKVAHAVARTFNEVLDDMQSMQEFGSISTETRVLLGTQ